MSATPAPMNVTLSWQDPATGATLRVQHTLPIVIGRDATSDVVLPGERVSRRHAVIQQEGDDVILVDQGSTNGVIVDGSPRQQVRLQSGDVFVIGNYALQVAIQAPSVPKAQRSPATGPGTLIFDEDADALRPLALIREARESFPPPAFAAQRVRPARLEEAGIQIE